MPRAAAVSLVSVRCLEEDRRAEAA